MSNISTFFDIFRTYCPKCVYGFQTGFGRVQRNPSLPKTDKRTSKVPSSLADFISDRFSLNFIRNIRYLLYVFNFKKKQKKKTMRKYSSKRILLIGINFSRLTPRKHSHYYRRQDLVHGVSMHSIER